MKISELSKRTGASARSLRYYEEKGLIHSDRSANGYRNYADSMVDQIRTIQLYFNLGLNSDQVKQGINCDPIIFPYDKLVCPEVIEVYKKKISEVSQQINWLKDIQSRLEERMALTLQSLEREKEKRQRSVICDEGQTLNLNRSKRVSALIALSLSVFIIGTAELLPMGLLLPIAGDFHIGISLTGMLVTGYALGVAIGGPPIFALAGRLPRKTLLCLFLLVFIIGGAICTFATTFWMLLLGRIISSFAHDIFFGMAVLTAKDLAPAEKEGTYISIVMMGITLSVIFGAPAGAFTGTQLGWRAAFLMITLLSVLTLILLLVGLPNLPRLEKVSLKDQLMKLENGKFIAAFLATTFCIGGFFAGFTYISPLLENVTGFSAHSISIILFIFGMGAIVGNILGGKQADKNLKRTIFTGTSLLILSLIMLSILSHMKPASVIAIFILGVASYGIMTPFQLLMLQKSAGAEELASTINISAFNLGNAIGPLIGSLTLICGWGLGIIPLAGAIAVFVGLLFSAMCQAKEKEPTKYV